MEEDTVTHTHVRAYTNTLWFFMDCPQESDLLKPSRFISKVHWTHSKAQKIWNLNIAVFHLHFFKEEAFCCNRTSVSTGAHKLCEGQVVISSLPVLYQWTSSSFFFWKVYEHNIYFFLYSAWHKHAYLVYISTLE